MVRIIAGTLVDVGLGKIEVEEIPEIIESKERARAGKTLAAHGLYLVEVKYNKDWHKYKNIVKLINV